MADLPILKTARTTIVPFNETFISPRYIGWLNDPDITRFSRQRHRRHDEESCREYFSSFKNSNNHFSAIVSDDQTRGHIGNLSTIVDGDNGVADLAILIGEKGVWGQGYGQEVWRAALAALLALPGIRLVTGGCLSENLPMRRIMEKTGMTPYYTRRGYFVWNDHPVDSVHYVAEKSTWKG